MKSLYLIQAPHIVSVLGWLFLGSSIFAFFRAGGPEKLWALVKGPLRYPLILFGLAAWPGACIYSGLHPQGVRTVLAEKVTKELSADSFEGCRKQRALVEAATLPVMCKKLADGSYEYRCLGIDSSLAEARLTAQLGPDCQVEQLPFSRKKQLLWSVFFGLFAAFFGLFWGRFLEKKDD